MPVDREGELQLIVEENAGWIEGNTASQSLVREEQLNGKCNAGGDATERRRLIFEGTAAQHGGACWPCPGTRVPQARTSPRSLQLTHTPATQGGR
jgi:hypothetical protein